MSRIRKVWDPCTVSIYVYSLVEKKLVDSTGASMMAYATSFRILYTGLVRIAFPSARQTIGVHKPTFCDQNLQQLDRQTRLACGEPRGARGTQSDINARALIFGHALLADVDPKGPSTQL